MVDPVPRVYAQQVLGRQPLEGQRRQSRDALRERLALHELHREERHVAVGARAQHGDDAGVSQPRHGLDLAPEATAAVGEVEQLGPQDLERDVAPDGDIASTVDDAHATAAERLGELEAVDPRIRRGWRRSRGAPEQIQASQRLEAAPQTIGVRGPFPTRRSQRELRIVGGQDPGQDLLQILWRRAVFRVHDEAASCPAKHLTGPAKDTLFSEDMGDLSETIHGASRGDRAALEELLSRYLPELRAFVRLHMGPLAQLEQSGDVVQSVCRVVLEDLGAFDYRGEAAFRSWLFRACANRIRDHQRHHLRDRRDARRAVALSDSVVEHVDRMQTPSGDLMRREDLCRLEAALDRLPDDYRRAITLHHFLGLSHKEIAEELGRGEGASRMLLHRALARLGLELGEESRGQRSR